MRDLEVKVTVNGEAAAVNLQEITMLAMKDAARRAAFEMQLEFAANEDMVALRRQLRKTIEDQYLAEFFRACCDYEAEYATKKIMRDRIKELEEKLMRYEIKQT